MLQQLFEQNIVENLKVGKSEKIIVAVSGGLDSMVLLNLLIKSSFDNLLVAHCNYNLRGEESDKDEELVKEFCEKNSINFETKSFETKKLKAELQMGTQELARKLRYDWFSELKTKHKAQYIATAHHEDDVIENFLIRIIRGSGIEGLKGIEAKKNDIIRPLLFTNKMDLLGFAKENDIPYRNDLSNESDDYLRNRVRNKLIPLLEDIQVNAKKNVLTTIKNIKEAEIFYQKSIKSTAKRYVISENDDSTSFDYEILNHPQAALLLFEILKKKGVNTTMIADVLSNNSNSSVGKKIAHGDVYFVFERSSLNFVKNKINPNKKTDLEETIILKKENKIININGADFEFCFFPSPKIIVFEKNALYLNADDLNFPLMIKNWENGDKFQPIGMMGAKKISDFLTDIKIDFNEKKSIKVLKDNSNNILAVIPFRSSQKTKINPETKEILRIKMI
jgi:tRNA(Ile)-lysidine synthase